MLDQLIDNIKQDTKNWEKFKELFVEREIAAKTILLHEGENHLIIIAKKLIRVIQYNS